MPTRTIDTRKHLKLTFSVPSHRYVHFYVEAENPVTTYILDDDGLAEFYASHDVPSYGGFTNRKRHNQEIRLPFKGHWYLVIMNERDYPVAIHYEVYL